MTLLISWFLIAGFGFNPIWYMISVGVWLFHLSAHDDSEIVRAIHKAIKNNSL